MKKYFLIGICGASMSSLAIFLKGHGFFVRGYDRNSHAELQKNGIEVKHEKETSDIDWADEVIFSSAFKEDDPLISYARQKHKPCFCRGKLLGDISSQFDKVIAVAGSHGKSTVTAMIYSILRVSGSSPSLHVGALLRETGKGYDFSGDKIFVTEACEYHDNFLYLRPTISVVTNVEKEHMDYFHTFAKEKSSFQKFISSSEQCVQKLSLSACNVRCDEHGRVEFEVQKAGKHVMDIHLAIGGAYNAQNALYAIEVCKKLCVPNCYIKLGLESFKGLQKRFEKVESHRQGKVFLDYAHHPGEIRSVAQSISCIPGRKVALFQPHTYSRTRSLMSEFVVELSQFDEVILFKTYAAREEEDPQVEAELLRRLSLLVPVSLQNDLDSLIAKLDQTQSDVLAIMGAGDLPEKLLEKGYIWR